jgi:hypothetical protein
MFHLAYTTTALTLYSEISLNVIIIGNSGFCLKGTNIKKNVGLKILRTGF